MTYEHLDIFSGIGGFALAARATGFRTVAFCESDPRCGAFLSKVWGLPVHADIRQLDGRRYRGTTLLTAGPPCQPASRAGNQGGSGDDRWLWPEALRVLAEIQPDCVVFENPLGILDVGLDGILSEMGGLGYEMQCFDIPACAVDSPQLRHRIWIVGFASGERSECERKPGIVASSRGETAREAQQRKRGGDAVRRSMADAGCPRCEGQERSRPAGSEGQSSGYARECDHNLADSAEPGREGRDSERAPDGCGAECAQSVLADAGLVSSNTRRDSESSGCEGTGTRVAPDGLHWSNSVWVPCADGKLRRAPDNSFSLVDGLHRSLLGALGNSIVPQVALEILRAIRKELDCK